MLRFFDQPVAEFFFVFDLCLRIDSCQLISSVPCSTAAESLSGAFQPSSVAFDASDKEASNLTLVTRQAGGEVACKLSGNKVAHLQNLPL